MYPIKLDFFLSGCIEESFGDNKEYIEEKKDITITRILPQTVSNSFFNSRFENGNKTHMLLTGIYLKRLYYSAEDSKTNYDLKNSVKTHMHKINKNFNDKQSFLLK